MKREPYYTIVHKETLFSYKQYGFYHLGKWKNIKPKHIRNHFHQNVYVRTYIRVLL